MSQSNKTVKAENDPRIFREVRTFLRALNSGTGKLRNLVLQMHDRF
jgi:hypothetical protein